MVDAWLARFETVRAVDRHEARQAPPSAHRAIWARRRERIGR
jgi:hypothetical protein